MKGVTWIRPQISTRPGSGGRAEAAGLSDPAVSIGNGAVVGGEMQLGWVKRPDLSPVPLYRP